jgi:hypothetical protein
MSHKVRTHKWFNGILTFSDSVFDSLDEAMGFAHEVEGDTVKIFDENDQIVHHIDKTQKEINTYA